MLIYIMQVRYLCLLIAVFETMTHGSMSRYDQLVKFNIRIENIYINNIVYIFSQRFSSYIIYLSRSVTRL